MNVHRNFICNSENLEQVCMSFNGQWLYQLWNIYILEYLLALLAKLLQSCSTLCDPMDYSLPGSSVHGILQARLLQWVAISLLQGIFPTQRWNLGLLQCRFFTIWATRLYQVYWCDPVMVDCFCFFFFNLLIEILLHIA